MPDFDMQNRSRGLALFLLVVSGLWCALWFVHALPYWEDDAYIHLEFARSVAQHQGFAFNGHVVYGDTSPLWVYLLVAFHAVLPDWMAAGKLLSLAGVLFSTAGVWFYARNLTRSALFAASITFLFVVNPYFNYWSFSGMETIMAAGTGLWAASLLSQKNLSWTGFLLVCLLAGIAPITRPEMVFLSAILGVILLYRWLHLPGSRGQRLAGFLVGGIFATGPALAWGLYALHTFGRLIPNTNAAKRAAPSDSVLLRLLDVYALGFPVIPLVLIAALLALIYLWIRRDRRFRSLPWKQLPLEVWIFLTWSGITAAFYIANHTYVQTRYIFVSAPGLLIALLAILYRRTTALYRIALWGSVAAALLVSILTTWPFLHNKGEEDRILTQASLWIQKNLPPDAPVATFSIGQIAYISQHPIIDTGGITRPGVIPYLYQAPEALERWIHSEGAAYSLTKDPPEPGATLVYSVDTPIGGWSLNPHYYRRTTKLNLWKLPPTPNTASSPQ